MTKTIGVLIVLGVAGTGTRVGAETGEVVAAGALALTGSGTRETVAEARLAGACAVHEESRRASAPVVGTQDRVRFAGVALVVQGAETRVAGVVAGDAVRVAVVGVAWTSTLAAAQGAAGSAGCAVVAVGPVAGAAREVAAETVAVAAIEVEAGVAGAGVACQCGVGLATCALVVASSRTCEASIVAGLAVVWDSEVTGSAHTGEVVLDDGIVLAAQAVRRGWT